MKIEVSIGEIVDKITILSIKLKKIKNEEKLKNIRKEFEILKLSLKELSISTNLTEFTRLKEVNLKLWDIEDKIRIKEAKQEFDDEFIQLARSVYFENDKRSEIKKDINLKFGSDLIEEKEYVKYS